MDKESYIEAYDSANDKMGFKKTDLAERRRKLYFIPVEVVDNGG